MIIVENTPSPDATELGAATPATRAVLVCEDAGGHVTFGNTLELAAEARPDIDLDVIWLPYAPQARWERLACVRGNWSIRASLRTRTLLRDRLDEYDVVLVHTQTAALALVGQMGRRPFVLSTDATPISYDEVGIPHGHTRGHPLAEALKRRVVARAYRSAAGVLAWSDWVGDSLIGDYGVDPARIHRIPAGVSLSEPAARDDRDGPVRLLYVARDFTAKGGEYLLQALEPLRGWHLDAVTTSRRPAMPGVTIHNGLTPSSPELAELYRGADVMVLPTLGDSSPFAILEGMAAGLPVITTPVGAITELVTPEAGMMVAPRDVTALRAAIARLLASPQLRLRMGAAARARVENHYEADRQFGRVLDLLCVLGERGAPVGAR